MERLFLDTNVVVDLLGEREPFYESAAKIASLADNGKIELVVSALTYSTVFYLLSRYENQSIAKEKIRKFKVIAQTADLTDTVLNKGLSSNFSDFEDALQYYCAVSSNCTLIITRNGKDFKESDIPVLTPDEYLNSLHKV
ncbi:PIN domain nuclease [Algoriphagus jejuensis]|uniref:PIN domain nuclease n=1 Tax=Algoriphagus jejuensis TaxID=419934 RepID=A0ABN1N076_9BACT